MYTLGTAAKATGLNKSTILRSIKSGRISATRTEAGWSIDPAELHRVFPAVATPDNVQSNDPQPSQPWQGRPTDAEVAAMVAGLREVAELLRRQLDDTRADRDRWQSEAGHWRVQAQSLLPAPAAPAAPTAPPRSWWQRLAG